MSQYNSFPVYPTVPWALPAADTFICNTLDGDGLKRELDDKEEKRNRVEDRERGRE